MLMPRRPVPTLKVPTLTHGDYQLTSDTPQNFALAVFYRGLHCPICLKYLLELARLQPEFEKRGVKVITIFSDTHERAQAFAEKLRSYDLRSGYGLSLTAAREWVDFALAKNYPARGEYAGEL